VATNTASTRLSLDVLKKFRVIFGSVRHHFRAIEQSCGISGSQLWILSEVALTPGVGVSELATRMSIHQTTCSQLVEKLVSREFLVKNRLKEDQRRVGLVLTKAGASALSRAPGPAEGMLPVALASLPDTVLKTLDGSLTEVIDRLAVRDHRIAEKPLADL